MTGPTGGPSFPRLIRQFFCERLVAQRRASPRTVAAYRDAFRLFLEYVQTRTGKRPSKLDLTDIDAELVVAFLDYPCVPTCLRQSPPSRLLKHEVGRELA